MTSESQNDKLSKTSKEETHEDPQKPPKPEDKPFKEFITEELIPTLEKAFSNFNIVPKQLLLIQDERPVTGGICWQLIGELN